MKLQFIIDTDIFSMWARQQEPAYSQLNANKHQGVAISIVNVEELLDGWVDRLRKCRRVEFHPIYASMMKMVNIIKDVPVVPLTESALEIYDELRSAFKGKGRHDLLIASIAKDRGVVLVTNNTQDFDYIDGLVIENWARP
jgi:tRNA(fMet)-specific endonuclease VapC